MGTIRNKNEHDYWNIFIGGLLQDEYEPHGIFRLYDRVNELDKYNAYCEFYTWDENWKAIARKIFLLSKLHKRIPIIKICAYSWGTWGAKQLTKYLGHFGFTVTDLLMVDPVYKMKYVPILTLFSKNVYMPANIEHIAYYKQENKWPKGHDVYQENSYSYDFIPPIKIIPDFNHEGMDDLSEFHDLVINKMIYCL